MKSFEIAGVKIETTAEVVAVYIDGKKQKPGVIQGLKNAAREYWSNSYFKKRTKAHISIKAAEVTARVVSIHSLYLVAREYILPHSQEILQLLQIAWNTLTFRIDLGFAAGVLFTAILINVKRSVSSWLKHKGGVL